MRAAGRSARPAAPARPACLQRFYGKAPPAPRMGGALHRDIATPRRRAAGTGAGA